MKKKTIIILLITLLIITFLLIINKFIISKNIKIVEYAIIDKKLPDNFHGLKIMHFSDIHFGKNTSISTIKKIKDKADKLRPDIIVFSGDFFDKNIKVSDNEIKKIKSEIDKIYAKYERYAILGDNDIKYKDKFYQIFDESYKILDNESSLFYLNSTTPLKITGFNDTSKEIKYENESKLYEIAILHKPDDADKLLNKYNIIFASHSMGGQIKFPFFGPIIKTNGCKKYTSGKYEVNNSVLYVNEGIGSYNISFRVNNSPKIDLYRLYSK